jgi:hypothetical protein
MSEIEPPPPAPVMLPEPSAENGIALVAERPPALPMHRAAPGTR